MARSNYDSESQYYSSDTEVDDDSEDDYVEAGKRKRQPKATIERKTKVKAPPKLGYIAEVTESANDGVDNSEETTSSRKADSQILARIRKALALANHPGTGEEEAKRAMRMAMKMMAAENVTQADLIANETAEERSTRAGHSTVSIRSTQGQSVRHQRWHTVANQAACEAFDVQMYYESYGKHLDFVFYGLADNTVAAALSFEMLHNQIETWALERKREKKLKGQVAGNSYRQGVATRVLKDAEKENLEILRKVKKAEERRVKQEEEARAAEIARLDQPNIPQIGVKVEEEETPLPKPAPTIEEVPDEAAPPTQAGQRKAQEDSAQDDRCPPPMNLDDMDDSEDDDIDRGAGFHFQDAGAQDFDVDALEREIKARAERPQSPRSPPSKPRPRTPTPVPVVSPEPKTESSTKEAGTDNAPSWTSALQLRTFKDNAKTIADDYLKSTGLKLTKGRKFGKVQHDTRAFNLGWDDGRKVDLKRRRIEDEMIREFKVEED